MSDPRAIPSVDRFLQRPGLRDLQERFGREATLDASRVAMEAFRRRLTVDPRPADGGDDDISDPAAWLERAVGANLHRTFSPSLVPVINATGVIVHTNLGRAPLAAAAIDRVRALAGGYVNLEYDLASGRRGSRNAHAEQLIARLTGAEAALVVNNNAAATLLLLAGLATGREVIVSRGELVEIGGGFRVPDILALSGATLREVGTTNRTRAIDYAAAISDRTGLILRIHPSNFRIEGFTERPTMHELVALGQRFDVPVVEDQGSGNLTAFRTQPGAEHRGMLSDGHDVGGAGVEPTVQESIRAGCDAVCFSGDKLLGGPQAGIVAGRSVVVERVRAHPFLRAVRVDKLTYAALEATLIEHLAGRGAVTVPVLRSLAMTRESIGERAERLRERLGGGARLRVGIVDGFSTVGGGSAPGSRLPTRLLTIEVEGRSAEHLERHLRLGEPPVIARIEHDLVVVDLRTVLPEQDNLLVAALART